MEHQGRLTKDGIRIYEDADFPGIRAACQVTAQILDEVAPLQAGPSRPFEAEASARPWLFRQDAEREGRVRILGLYR